MPELDTYRHQGMRKNLVKTLISKGIENTEVLAAIEKIPRHLFLDKTFVEHAYEDKAFRIGAGQTISHPYTVAYQSSLLALQKGEKVLEIGTGSGYQCCVLMEMGAKVFSVERQKELFDKAKIFIPSLGYHPKLFYGDGYKGLPAFAPFDKILVTAGAPFVPKELTHQLKVGGVLVIPVGEGATQVMKRITRTGTETFKTEELDTFSFVPLLENKVNKA